MKTSIGVSAYRQISTLHLRAIIKNATWLALIQVFNYTFPLVTLLVVTRAFGPHIFGIVSTLTAYGLYVGVVANYGLSVTGPRSIARLRADPQLLSKTISEFLTIQFLFGAAAIMIFLRSSLSFHTSESIRSPASLFLCKCSQRRRPRNGFMLVWNNLAISRSINSFSAGLQQSSSCF
jgi:polysaccharide transporter, PST family